MKNRRLVIFHLVPLFVVLFPALWFIVVGNDRLLKGEAGIIENTTVLFLVAAIGFCISGISNANRLGLPSLVKVWLFIMIMGSAYFALEEISYGQHMFGWGTADSWKQLNDQDETNLHNVHAMFDQVPRALLTLGILIGGFLLPLYRHFRGIRLDQSSRLYWQWPTLDCVTIGLLVILIRPVLSLIDVDFINTGEMKENLFALFILLYCVSIQQRLKRKQMPGAETTSA
ncbi:MAG: hypothetical protein GY802_08320 [Gammaproteobacteria bacterium]|nr:hypothetical protein [Gammaproteobacteria bacterium]